MKMKEIKHNVDLPDDAFKRPGVGDRTGQEKGGVTVSWNRMRSDGPTGRPPARFTGSQGATADAASISIV